VNSHAFGIGARNRNSVVGFFINNKSLRADRQWS